eukprot:m.278632 g.278632  ORF g.278632 m.278632 type:complete len:599 (+) comp16316_c1_seq7:78-1874(+)
MAWRLFHSVLLCCLCVNGLDNGLGRTPALGWSSWNKFAGNVNEKILLEAADAFVSSGLRDAGYEYINLDDGWSIGRNATGHHIPDPKKFPHGIQYIADYIHKQGLKFGIYTARGSKTCMGRPGSDSHEQIDADTFAAWGVDYLKEDSCGGTVHGTVWQQYARMRDALNKTGRPIYFSVTQGVPYPDSHMSMHCYGDSVFTVKTWLQQGLDPRTLANSYLVEYCNNMDKFGYTNGIPSPGGFLSNLDSQQLLSYDNMTTVGAYNDNDMLEVCNGGQTTAEYRSQFSTWAILSSPLILGNDLTSMDEDCKSIVLNKEVIAINQDPLVSRGKLVYQFPDAKWPNTSMVTDRTPSPSETGLLTLAPCSTSNATKGQLFTWNKTDGLLRNVGTGHCVTYFGYHESNVGLATCDGWATPGIGGMRWNITDNGDGTSSLYNIGNGDKCMDVYNCDTSTSKAVQVCSCSPGGDADCFEEGAAKKTCSEHNKRWTIPMPTGNGVPITTALNENLCLTTTTFHNSVNITMQVWGKPLHNGNTAVVAFNRDTNTGVVDINSTWFGLSATKKYNVRDTWQHQDIGSFTGTLPNVVVQPHDVRTFIFSPAN